MQKTRLFNSMQPCRFTIAPLDGGNKWVGKCWYIHNLIKYEFDFQFEIPATYPATAPEIELPELDGKTSKMYRGGKICLTIHFKVSLSAG